MFVNISNSNRGDTLIEVLLAVAIFSLVAVGSLSIMNQGTSTTQRALEITLVRQEIDSQAEALRFLNASYIADVSSVQWKKIQSKADMTVGDVSPFNSISSCTIPTNAFILNTHTAEYMDTATYKPVPAVTFSQVRYNQSNPSIFIRAEGIWIEAVRVSRSDNYQSNAGRIDFHIRACWNSPGQSVPVTLGTIVRLYEPI